jgi:hypothetical protein
MFVPFQNNQRKKELNFQFELGVLYSLGILKCVYAGFSFILIYPQVYMRINIKPYLVGTIVLLI